MTASGTVVLSPTQRAALDALGRDLTHVFGVRLESLVAYDVGHATSDESVIRTLGLVERVTFDDLRQLAPLTPRWHRQALAVPLLLTRHEFLRTLDVFPLEYGNIIANHIMIAGEDPFGGAKVADVDRRRGCEQQAKSHLIHLREGFLETEGSTREITELIVASVPAFRTLLTNIAQLEDPHAGFSDDDLAATADARMGIRRAVVKEILSAPVAAGSIVDPNAQLAGYIEASERIWRYVDGWRA